VADGQVTLIHPVGGGILGLMPQYDATGQRIVYVNTYTKSVDQVNADGSNHKVLATVAKNPNRPTFSKDGKKIAYSSVLAGTLNEEIFVKNLVTNGDHASDQLRGPRLRADLVARRDEDRVHQPAVRAVPGVGHERHGGESGAASLTPPPSNRRRSGPTRRRQPDAGLQVNRRRDSRSRRRFAHSGSALLDVLRATIDARDRGPDDRGMRCLD
jgi:Periplasmic component of the Tol biopolymer transport system